MAANIPLAMNAAADNVHLTVTDTGFDVVRGGVAEGSINVGVGERLRTAAGETRDTLTLDLTDREAFVKVRDGRLILEESGVERAVLDGFGHVNVVSDAAGPSEVKIVGSDGSDHVDGTFRRVEATWAGGRTAKVRGPSQIRANLGEGDDSAVLRDLPQAGETVRLVPEAPRITAGGGDKKFVVHNVESVHAVADPTDDGSKLKVYGQRDAANVVTATEERLRMTAPGIEFTADHFRVSEFDSRHGEAGEGDAVDDIVRVYDTLWDEGNGFAPPLEWERARSRNKFTIEDDDPTDSRFRQLDGPETTFNHHFVGFHVDEIVLNRRRNLAGTVDASGALGGNADWDGTGEYFIEQQRYGYNLIAAGLATEDQSLIDEGLSVIEWGLARQDTDPQSVDYGSFPGTGDELHSTTLFAHAVGESITRLDAAGYDTTAFRDRWIDSLESATAWLAAQRTVGAVNNLEPFAHRYFMRASQMFRAYELTGVTAFRDVAAEYVAGGRAKLTADGVLPERPDVDGVGFDLSYQSLALKYAAELRQMIEVRGDVGDADLSTMVTQLSEVSAAAFAPIDARIADNGEPDLSDSTRINEDGRGGGRKSFDSRNAIDGYLALSQLVDDDVRSNAWADLADRLWQRF